MLFFKQEGFHLNDQVFAEVQNLVIRISQLEADFAKNLDEDLSYIWVRLEDLQGVPERVICSLEHQNNVYCVTCQKPHYFPIMKYCHVKSTKKPCAKLIKIGPLLVCFAHSDHCLMSLI